MIEQRGREVRRRMALPVFLVAASLITGCNSIQLPGMTKADTKWLQQPEIQRIRADIYLPKDKIGPFDVVELRLETTGEKDSKKPLVVPVSLKLASPLKRCDGTAAAWSAGTQVSNVVRPRIPVALLAGINELSIQPTGGSAASIKLCGEKGSIFDKDGVTDWAALRKKLESAKPSDAKWSVHAELLRVFPRYALPGDELRITAYSRFGINADMPPQPYNATQVLTRIDSEGYASFPLLSAPSSSAAPTDTGLDGKWTAALNGALSLTRVWLPGTELDKQPVLDDIASCFSLQEWPGAVPDDACDRVGVDRDVVRTTDNMNLRYRIEPIQYWSLVLEGSHSFQEPYAPGVSIESAVRQAYLKHAGRPLAEPTFGHLYLAVLPQPTLGREGSKSFWGRLEPAKEDVMNRVYLLPGDTVFVTHAVRRTP